MMIIYSGAVEGACQMPRNDYEKVVELAKGYDIALFQWRFSHKDRLFRRRPLMAAKRSAILFQNLRV